MYKLYKEAVIKEPMNPLQKGERGKLILEHSGLYMVDFGKQKGKHKVMH